MRTVKITTWFKSNLPGMEIEDIHGGMITAWPNSRPIHLFAHQHSTDKHMNIQSSCNTQWNYTKSMFEMESTQVVKQSGLVWPVGTKTPDLFASLWQH
jgi:hypothetical protein